MSEPTTELGPTPTPGAHRGGSALVVSDMDGTLATEDTWRGVHAWILANHPSPAARRFIAMQLPRIVIVRLGLASKDAFRSRWLEDHAVLLRGVPADRLTEMGEWVVANHLWPSRRQPAIDAVAQAAEALRAAGNDVDVVLATGAYQPVADAFAAHIGAAHALGTPLEVADGLATGRLALPTQSGEQKAAAVRALAGDRRIAAAFGDTAADVPLLMLAERATAVVPDAALRRVAVQQGWDVLDT